MKQLLDTVPEHSKIICTNTTDPYLIDIDNDSLVINNKKDIAIIGVDKTQTLISFVSNEHSTSIEEGLIVQGDSSIILMDIRLGGNNHSCIYLQDDAMLTAYNIICYADEHGVIITDNANFIAYDTEIAVNSGQSAIVLEDSTTKLTINSGEFKSFSPHYAIDNTGQSTNIIVRGGSFEPPIDSSYVAEGYELIINGDTGTVIPTE